MQPISPRTHGILDYLTGALLILSPRLFGFEEGSTEAAVPVFLGWSAVVYSLFTRYELGLVRVLPFNAHLTLDIMNGGFLAISPWHFGFADRVWLPHLLLGLFEIGAVLLTRRSTPTVNHEQGRFGGTPAGH